MEIIFEYISCGIVMLGINKLQQVFNLFFDLIIIIIIIEEKKCV